MELLPGHRYGVAPHVREHLRKDGARIFIHGSVQPLAGVDGQIREFIKIGQDVTDARRVQQALADSEQRLRTLTEGIPQLVWRADDEGHWTWSSPQWQACTGQSPDESLGLGWLEAVHPDDRAAVMHAWAEALGKGAIDVEHRVRRAADGEYLWHHTRSLPVRNESGRVVEWLGTSTDVQQLKELQERQAVLVAELQHRTRNLLGLVRSTADKTMGRSVDFDDFRDRFSDRLAALARVQRLLSRLQDWDRVTFDELLHSELSAINGGAERVSLDGPKGVALRSSTVQTFALAIHELATNALKYGALSQQQACLEIRWRIERSGKDGRPWLCVDWRESGVVMPTRDTSPRGGGAGRELIERALPYQLGANTTLVMGPDGVHCTIAMPVSERQPAQEMADA
jgi:PAS domain S-box-containing protein